MSRALHCTVCDTWIEKWADEEFEYDRDSEGPYCDRCWVWQSKIDALAEEVQVLRERADIRRINEWRA